MSPNSCKKQLKKQRSDHNYNYIPEELLEKIRLYLSPEDLQNYKLVSKFWFSFISRHDFVKKHFNFTHSRSDQSLDRKIMFTTITKPTNLNTNFVYRQYSLANKDAAIIKELHLPSSKLNVPYAFALIASCNGLLLFQDKYSPNQLYISNPLTADFDHLPLMNTPLQCLHWALVHMVSSNTYKVFGIMSASLFLVLTFGDKKALNRNDWIIWDNDDDDKPSLPLSQLLVVGNEVHWLTTVLQPCCYCVYSINMETIVVSRNIVPLNIVRPCDADAFGLLSLVKEGSLCLTTVSPNQLQMFVLKDGDTPIWIPSLSVRLESLSNRPHFFENFSSDNICLVPMRGVEANNLLDLVQVLIHYEDQLFLFDLKTQEFRQIGFLSKDQKLDRPYFHHSSSLLSWTWMSTTYNGLGVYRCNSAPKFKRGNFLWGKRNV